MIKISQCDGEIENRRAVINKDSLRVQNWFTMIKIGSQCDGEMENRLVVIKKDSLPDQLVLSVMGKWKPSSW